MLFSIFILNVPAKPMWRFWGFNLFTIYKHNFEQCLHFVNFTFLICLKLEILAKTTLVSYSIMMFKLPQPNQQPKTT